MSDSIERKLARVRARDEVNELIEEQATALADAEDSKAFSRHLPDDPERQQERDNYRARARIALNMPCCDQHGIGDHDPVEHGGGQ